MNPENEKQAAESAFEKAKRVANDFEGEITRYQAERSHANGQEVTWLDAFNNRCAILSLCIPRAHSAYNILREIIEKTHTVTEQDITDQHKVEFLSLVDELRDELNA